MTATDYPAPATFQPGQKVKGHYHGRAILEAVVLTVEENDYVTVRVTWGAGSLVGPRPLRVAAAWLDLVTP